MVRDMPVTPENDISDRDWHVRGTGRPIKVHPGVMISEVVRAHGPLLTVPTNDLATSGAATGEDFRLEIEAIYSSNLGHYLMRSFALHAEPEYEVTGALLRTVAPLGVMRWLLPRTFEIDASALSVPVADFIAPELAQYRQTSNGSAGSIMLKDVGTVYSLARAVRYPPAKAVAETFNLQARTATNWILKARTNGFI